MITRRSVILGFGGAAMAAAVSRAQTGGDQVRLALNPSVYANLPLFIAIDKGYFRDNGIEIALTKYAGSASTQLPLLARGDLDVAPVVGSAALFNQLEQGFNIRLVSALTSARQGWHDSTWVIVSKDLWDSGALKQPADMRGKRVDGGPEGSPVMFLTFQALTAGGLAKADVVFSQRVKAPQDLLAVFRNKAVDILASPEPIAAQLEAEGLAHRWLSAVDIAPWFQEAFLGASPEFLANRPDVAKRLLKGVLAGLRDVAAAGAVWTPELLGITSAWTGIKADILARIPGPAYPGDRGAINVDSLERQQQFWVAQGKIKTPVLMPSLVDTRLLEAAIAETKS